MIGRSVASNWHKIQEKILKAQKRSTVASANICVVGVSKLQPEAKIKEALTLGITDFGENYVQEFTEKMETLQSEKINWHFIGALQTNKAKFIVGKVKLIHTVDRLNLAETLSRIASEQNLVQDLLIQVNVSGEESKGGVSLDEAVRFAADIMTLPGLGIRGLMTMPPGTANAEDSRVCFRKLRQLQKGLNDTTFRHKPLDVLSMGTSQDYEVAVEEGATHIRVGSSLFGERHK